MIDSVQDTMTTEGMRRRLSEMRKTGDTTTTEGMRKRLSEMRKTGDTTTTEGMRRRLSEMRRNGAEKRGSDKLENFKNKKSKTLENQSSIIPPLIPSSFSLDSSLLSKSPAQQPSSRSPGRSPSSRSLV